MIYYRKYIMEYLLEHNVMMVYDKPLEAFIDRFFKSKGLRCREDNARVCLRRELESMVKDGTLHAEEIFGIKYYQINL